MENENKFSKEFVLGFQSGLANSGEALAAGSRKSSHQLLDQLNELMKINKTNGGGGSLDQKISADAVDTKGDSLDKADVDVLDADGMES